VNVYVTGEGGFLPIRRDAALSASLSPHSRFMHLDAEERVYIASKFSHGGASSVSIFGGKGRMN
jgi:hypothetical protein